MLTGLCCLLLSFTTLSPQATSPAAPPPPVQESSAPKLSSSEIARLQSAAKAGDVSSEIRLAKAYRDGNGVQQDEALAFQWFKKAADQGDATAQNDLGVMYRMGSGVSRDKEQAVRWYTKSARQGNAEAMFNLGACYYNGDGVNSNEYTAYAWFLLAQKAGSAAGDDAARRSAATMPSLGTSNAYLQIASMYEKGDVVRRDDAEAMFWLRKAADIASVGKVRLASHFLLSPDASGHYIEALNLCKTAAKDYNPGLVCVAYIYRKGMGVHPDPGEAIKWYQKAVASSNGLAMLALAEMYSTGEGTKIDRPAAMILLVRASSMRIPGAQQKAGELLKQLDSSEMKHFQKKLREQRLDPKKVLAELQAVSPS